eukprot:GFKZ01002437.1.p1 GENE.GFKZ01002437.1~~GFKZ01002437.1.p1  ORF type:complete len:274 (+),score=19.16 GFKZ01002437.1:747-1568(+)
MSCKNVPFPRSVLRAVSCYLPDPSELCITSVESRGETTLVRINSHVLLKYGPTVRPVEADTLRFIAKNTSIPVPKVYGVHIDDDSVAYIIMQYIGGENLLSVWSSLRNSEKEAIGEQLKGFLRDLRRFREDYIGALGKQPCRDVLLEECKERGPFYTEEEMNQIAVSSSKCGSHPPESFVKATTRGLPTNHDFVLTHGDLTPENIIVDRKQGVIKAVVGWGFAGFFPEFWEFVNALSLQDWKSDWVVYAQNALDPYYEEFSLWYRIRLMAYGL